MKTDKFDFLTKQFSIYEITYSKNGDLIEIINPFCDENIRVEYMPDDDFTPYIVYFAFQHCHMCDEEDVIEWITDIITGNIVTIEFFKNGKSCFGFDVETQELKGLSYAKLEQITGYYGLTKSLEIADSFKVSGWDNNHNFDAVLVKDDNGSTTVKRLCT